jgi:short-subunit dehydrogenase
MRPNALFENGSAGSHTCCVSIRYELRDIGMSVTALQPGSTDIDFFHRAGMDDTQVGLEGKKESPPDEVAKQWIDALLAGNDHVYATRGNGRNKRAGQAHRRAYVALGGSR